ncbi:MAG: 3-deoxy-7-phosphoheptulonate synthase [Oxalobacter sp.]|jgi:3-deoxy-7-phosphoheptulonate synthase|nr:3-deoxy-7-phosphoheptulonate synthase [Oxalobacter sp.]MBR6000864.1 3-deoxy-7-phosphoheptulonate synthase [Oxalobacter sp.]
MQKPIDDLRIVAMKELTPPSHLISAFPCRAETAVTVSGCRDDIHKVLHGEDDRLVAIIGPCSIHDPKAAIEYAERLRAERERYKDDLIILMRVYFEKPRTTIGWKGLINDPFLDQSYRINEGLHIARELLQKVNMMGLPAATEFLDMISPQYIADMVSWGAIGARTTESQVHRELSSGLSCPVGFKNGTDGNVKIAIDAIKAASHPHHFLSVTKSGHTAIFQTQGNQDCHIILRGGFKPNYDPQSVDEAVHALETNGISPNIMIDASHGNSSKKAENQIPVCENIGENIASGNKHIIGVMVESNLVAGRQDLGDGKNLTYGQSVTDACLGWQDSSVLLGKLAEAVRRRRDAKVQK